MRWKRFITTIGMVGAGFGLTAPSFALGQSSVATSGSVTLSATVLEHRGIIVDDDQSIIEIFSNTNNNVAPTVTRQTYGGASVPLTPKLKRQYNEIMAQVKHNHDLIITRAKTVMPLNFVEPATSALFTAAPAATDDDPDHIPYFIQLGQASF